MNKLAVLTTCDRRISRKRRWYQFFLLRKFYEVYFFPEYDLELTIIYFPFSISSLETADIKELSRFISKLESFLMENSINDLIMDEDVWNQSHGRININDVFLHDGNYLKRDFAFEIFCSFRKEFMDDKIIPSVCIVDKSFSQFSAGLICDICRFVKYIYVDTDDYNAFEYFSSLLYSDYGLLLQNAEKAKASAGLIILVESDGAYRIQSKSAIINFSKDQYFENNHMVINDIDFDFSLSMVYDSYGSFLKIIENVFYDKCGARFKVKKTHILQSFVKLGLIKNSGISFKSFL